MASVKLRQRLSLGRKCLDKETEEASCRKMALIQDEKGEKRQQQVARSSKHTVQVTRGRSSVLFALLLDR